MIRDHVRALIACWAEVLAAALLLLAGLWFVLLGGWFLVPLGGLTLMVAAVWAVQAWRRLRFAARAGTAGLVQVDEAQIAYFSASGGGFIALPDLSELRLVALGSARMWRLKQTDGQALLIPVTATGAELLFDALSTLPGMDTGALVGALESPDAPALRPIWTRAKR